MGSESLVASVGLLVASALWAGLVASGNRKLVRSTGEVVSLRPVKRGGANRFLPTVRFASEGEYYEVEIPEPGEMSVGTDTEVLHPAGRPDLASLHRRSFLGPLVLLVVALILAVAAL